MIKNTPEGKRVVKNPETAPIMEDLIDHSAMLCYPKK